MAFNNPGVHKRSIPIRMTIISLCTGFLFLASTCTPKRPVQKPNIIVICVDSLRADHLGCYGYHRNTSPNIDSLARDGSLFRQTFANSSFTRESVSVIHTGLLPSVSGSTGLRAFPAKTLKVMSEYFREAGYQTGFFTASQILANPGYYRGYSAVFAFEKSNKQNSSALSSQVNEFIEKNQDRPFMMYVHYFDPHNPYTPSLEYYKRFSPVVFADPIDLKQEMRTECKNWVRNGFGPGESHYEDMLLRYDAEIADTDHAIGQVLDKLKALNLQDNTIIVLTADHGEEFLEHRYLVHAWTLFRESIHIPLIIRGESQLSGRSFSERVSSVDILPTLLSLARIPYDPTNLNGESLFNLRSGKFFFKPPTRPYIGELLLQHRNILRAVIRNDWKYMAYVIWTEPEKRPRKTQKTPQEIAKDPALQVDVWSPIQREELFHVSDDPEEQHNLLNLQPTISDEMRRILARYESRCKVMRRDASNRVNTNPLTARELEKLKGLGYL